MKNKKTLILLCCFTLLLALVLVGCGTSAQTASTTPTPPPAATAATKAEPVKSLVAQVQATQHAKMFPTLIAEAEKDKNFDYADNCIKCHAEVSILGDKSAKMVDFFKGGKYETQREGITCNVCHVVGGKDMFGLRKTGWDSCTQCHTTDKPEIKLGSQLHHSQKEMIEGTPVGNGPATPSYKFKNMKSNFSCVDCHITNNTDHDFMVPGVTPTYDALGTTRTGTTMDWDKFATVFKQEKCVTCHADPKPVVNKLKASSEEISKKAEALKPIYDEWTKKVATMDKNDPKVIAFNNGATYFTYVEADASKGAHNPEYAKQLLTKCETEWAKLK